MPGHVEDNKVLKSKALNPKSETPDSSANEAAIEDFASLRKFELPKKANTKTKKESNPRHKWRG